MPSNTLGLHAALILNLDFSVQSSTFLKNIDFSGTHGFKSLQSCATVLPLISVETGPAPLHQTFLIQTLPNSSSLYSFVL